MFKEHHYLNGNISTASRCYVGVWDDNIVSFGATMTLPSGSLKNAWRGHRTVVLPDYQGMGIGVRFSDGIGEIHLAQGHRYYSRTAHPRMGNYREQSKLWRATSKNRVLRKDKKNPNSIYNNHFVDHKRICFSHEYMGNLIK